MFRAYSHILRVPHVRSRLAAVFLSSLPLGMLSLAIVLCVQGWTGELPAAGILSGLFGAGNAVGLTLQGPLLDRLRARKVVLPFGVVCGLSLVAFVGLGANGAPLWWTGTAGAAAGISVPAITAAVRSWLPEVLAEDPTRGTAYALLSALFRGAVTIGPLLVSASLLLHGPNMAVLLAAALILMASLVFSLLGPDQGRGSVAGRQSAGTNFVPSVGLWTLLVSAGLIGCAVGVTSVAVPGVLTSGGAPAMSGVAFAALACGEMLAALRFGASRRRGHRRRRLLMAQVSVVVISGSVYVAATEPWFLVVAMFLVGMARAPVSILQSSLLDDVMPKDNLARSYSLLVAVTLVSHSIGSALAGLLVDHIDVRTVLLVPVLVVLLGSIWTATRLRTLR